MKTKEDFEISQKEEDFEDEEEDWQDDRICPICGEDFIPRTRKQRYCSSECRIERNRRTVSKNYHIRTSTASTEWKLRMRKAGCIRCGFSDVVILHDIVPAIEGGDRTDPNNRIPLCPNCHSTLHRNKWKIWDIEDNLLRNPEYGSQYWLVQLLKSEDYKYPRNASRFASS